MILKVRYLTNLDIGKLVYTDEGYGILLGFENGKCKVMLIDYKGIKLFDNAYVCEKRKDETL